jgi:hypothetical protein
VRRAKHERAVLSSALLALVAAGYLLAALVTWRRAAWFFADKARYEAEKPFTNFEIIFGLLVGAVFATIWPLSVGIYILRSHAVPAVGRSFLLPPPHVRREFEADERAAQGRRIAELERETGNDWRELEP